MIEMKVKCPVCEEYVFEEEFERCPVCKWVLDKLQYKDPTYWGGSNKLSINDFKLKWKDEQLKRKLIRVAEAGDSKLPAEVIEILSEVLDRFFTTSQEKMPN